MTKRQAVEVLVYLINRVTLNKAEAVGANEAVTELLKDLPSEQPPAPPQQPP